MKPKLAFGELDDRIQTQVTHFYTFVSKICPKKVVNLVGEIHQNEL